MNTTQELAINDYINKIVEEEYEFIVEYQVIPVVYSVEVGDIPYYRKCSELFHGDSCLDINELRYFLKYRVRICLLKVNYEATLRLIRNIREVLTFLPVERNEDKIEITIRNSEEGIVLSYLSINDLVTKLLVDSRLLCGDLVNVEFSFSINSFTKSLKYIETIIRKEYDFFKKYEIVPRLVTNSKTFVNKWNYFRIKFSSESLDSLSDKNLNDLYSILRINSEIEHFNYSGILEFIIFTKSLLSKIDSVNNTHSLETEGGHIYYSSSIQDLVINILKLYTKGVKIIKIY